MKLDLEKTMADLREERRQQDEKDRAEIARLCADLEHLLINPSPEPDRLQRQAHLLDCYLYTVMRHNLHKDKQNGCLSETGIDLVLRIQKQCVDTMKAESAINYMRVLAPAPIHYMPPLPPPPPNFSERTGESE